MRSPAITLCSGRVSGLAVTAHPQLHHLVVEARDCDGHSIRSCYCCDLWGLWFERRAADRGLMCTWRVVLNVSVAPVSGRSRWHAYVVPHPPLRRSTALSETGGRGNRCCGSAELLGRRSSTSRRRCHPRDSAVRPTGRRDDLGDTGRPGDGNPRRRDPNSQHMSGRSSAPSRAASASRGSHHCGGMLRRRARCGTSSRRTDCRRAADRAVAGASGF